MATYYFNVHDGSAFTDKATAGDEAVSAGTGILLTNTANTAGAYSDIKWQYSSSDTSYASGIRFKQLNTTHGGQLEFFTDNTSGVFTQRITITEDGSVGIGTDDPVAKLHIWN